MSWEDILKRNYVRNFQPEQQSDEWLEEVKDKYIVYVASQGTLIDEEGNGSYGEWDGTDLSIHLEITSPRPHKAITLLHELIHGIDELCYMRLSHQNVYILSQVLYQIILQNPELIKYVSNSYSLEEGEGQRDRGSAGYAK